MNRSAGVRERLIPWPTALTGLEHCYVHELLDDAQGNLRIRCSHSRLEQEGLIEVLWRVGDVVAYANRDEGFQVALLKAAGGHLIPQHTFTVENSGWIAWLWSREPHMQDVFPDAVHYVIGTPDDVVEVLARRPPQIRSMRTVAS